MQGVRHRKTSYQRDFDIERSWIPSNKDITESMLSYSKRMSEYKKTKGIYGKNDAIELPLLIKATHLSHPNLPDRSERRDRESAANSKGYTYRARSLPNMKLEPLLGTKAKYEFNTTGILSLKSVNGVKLKFLKSTKLVQQLPSISDQPTRSDDVTHDKSETLVDAKTGQTQTEQHTTSLSEVEEEVASSETQTSEDDIQTTSATVTDSNLKQVSQNSSTPSIRHQGLKRKSKRMKFKKSQLSAIEEVDDSEALLQRLSRSSSLNKLPLALTYNSGSTIINNDSSYIDIQQSFEERRRDVALLRKIHHSTNSQKVSSQISMQSLAKKKLRKLAPLPIAKIATVDRSHDLT